MLSRGARAITQHRTRRLPLHLLRHASSSSSSPSASNPNPAAPSSSSTKDRDKGKGRSKDKDSRATSAIPVPEPSEPVSSAFASTSSDSAVSESAVLSTLVPPPSIPTEQSPTSTDDDPSSSGSSSSSSPSALAPLSATSLPLPPPPQPTPTPIRHQFNTHTFVRRLERASLSLSQSRAIMLAAREILTSYEARARRDGGTREALDNEAYLFAAALSELRTEVEVRARDDGLTLRSAQSGLQREVDSLERRITESMRGLGSEIQLDFNTRKEEASSDLKGLELKIVELNNKFTILLGDVRTDLEARKWVLTRRAIAMIAGTVLLAMIHLSIPKRSKESAAQPKAEDLGLHQLDEERATSSGVIAPWLNGRRVGEEDHEED